MSDLVIRVENLGNKYTLGHQSQDRYTALRDVIANGAKSVGRKFLKPFGKKICDPGIDEFWPLKDVSFEIKQGDRICGVWCARSIAANYRIFCAASILIPSTDTE